METMGIMESIGDLNWIKLALVVVVGYFILKFIWSAAKGIIKLVGAAIIIVLGIHFMNPSLLGGADVYVENGIEFFLKKTAEAVDTVKVEGEKLVDKKIGENVTN